MNALEIARDALEQIALAGMSGSGQESPEGLRDWHARRAMEFIGIAARALEAVKAAPQPEKTVKSAIMGFGRVGVGLTQDAESGRPGIAYLDLGEQREIDADTTDLFPVGSRPDADKFLAHVQFETAASVRQTIEELNKLLGDYFKEAPQPVAVPPELDVRRIMLDVVPGNDGMGAEVFAKSVDDVVEKLGRMSDRLELLAAPQPVAVPNPGSPEASAMIDSVLAEYNYPSNTKNAARAGYVAAMRLLAAAPQAPSRGPWQPIETAPQDGRTVLLGRFNELGNWRTMRGSWMSQACIDETWEDPDSAEPGWYETSAEADDVPNCWYVRPTHWMPLPAAPGITKEGAAAPQAPSREPLSIDEVRELIEGASLDWHNGWTVGDDATNRYLDLVRAIERAHGITKEGAAKKLAALAAAPQAPSREPLSDLASKLLEKLEAWQSVCDRITDHYGGVVAGINFGALGRANRETIECAHGITKEGGQP